MSVPVRIALVELGMKLDLIKRFAADQNTPPSLDAPHLRTALWFQAEGANDRLVTPDDSRAGRARELGLPVS